jgi:hypothetical protein
MKKIQLDNEIPQVEAKIQALIAGIPNIDSDYRERY